MESESKDSELISEAIAYMRNGEYELADQLFSEAIDFRGDHLCKAYYNKGVLYQNHLKEIEESIQYYDEAVLLNPNYGQAWHNKGEAYLHMDRYAEAREMFKKAKNLMPGAFPPRFGLAYTYNRLQNFSESIEIFEDLLDNPEIDNQRLAKVLSELGLALLKTNQLLPAYEHFKDAYQLDRNDYQTCYNIAFIADSFNNYNEAHIFYDKAISLNDAESKAYQGKACSYIHEGQYREALVYIEKAIELAPMNFEGYYNLACINAGLENEPELFKAIVKAIELAPPQLKIADYIRHDPDFQPYTANARFLSILENDN